MKQYSFLNESRNKFIKRLLRYTPQERQKITQTLIQNGKHGINRNGAYMKGMYSADEYGRRAFEGQKLRINKLADNAGLRRFQIKDKIGTDVLRGELYGQQEISLPAITDPLSLRFTPQLKNKDTFNAFKINATKNPTTISQRTIDTKGKIDSTYFRRLRKAVTKKNDVSIPLTGYTIANHEADELSAALKFAKKYGISLDDAVKKIRSMQGKSIGQHNPGVLQRERKLYRDLSTMYGRNSFFRIPRSKREFSVNLNTNL